MRIMSLSSIVHTPWKDFKEGFVDEEAGLAGKVAFLIGAGGPIISLAKMLFPELPISFPYTMQAHLIFGEICHKIGATLEGAYSGTIEMSTQFFNAVGTILADNFPSWFKMSDTLYQDYGSPIATNVGTEADTHIYSLGLAYLVLPTIGSFLIEGGKAVDKYCKPLGKAMIGAGVFMKSYPLVSTIGIYFSSTSMYRLFQEFNPNYNASQMEFNFLHAPLFALACYIGSGLIPHATKAIGKAINYYLGSSQSGIAQHSSS